MVRIEEHGFTLIELLIVIVIIGILAAIAIPKYASTKEKTYVTRMINDLHNLATSQEAYFIDNATYYSGSLPGPNLVFTPSTGVTLTIDEGTTTGWSATASTVGTSRQCMVFHGDAAPVAPATIDGRRLHAVSCTGPRHSRASRSGSSREVVDVCAIDSR